MIDSGYIRQISYGDLNKIFELEKKCFDIHLAYSRNQLKYLILNANSNCLVEVMDKVLRGFIIVLYRKGAKIASIDTLSVDPNFQKKGIGTCLLKAAEDDMYSRDIKKIKLVVSMNNFAALALYEKIGFRKTLTLDNYYKFKNNGTSDAFLMVKELT